MLPHQHSIDLAENRRRYMLPNDWLLVSLGLIIQVVVGYLFGHLYDIRIFMATGYLAGTGQNPYVPQDLSMIFHNLSFQGITTIGYPPPWSLVLGFIYLFSYRLIPNFLLYNLAIKTPIILANLCLAYLVADILSKLNVANKEVRAAWLFFLFNPFLIYASSAWGQFDSVVALFSLISMYLLFRENDTISAILLALTIALKPTALPLMCVAYIFFKNKPVHRKIKYGGMLFASMLVFSVAPFFIFRWDPSIILNNWNAHFTVGGGMTYMAFLELTINSINLPGNWWLVGLLWIPILFAAVLTIRTEIRSFSDLAATSAALIMIFFLSLAWLSEQNVILLLPFVVLLTSLGFLKKSILTLVWISPLVFGFFNTSFAQLFFPSMPEVMANLLHLAQEFTLPRLIAKILVVIPWIITGWIIVITCLKQSRIQPSIKF
jgi:hypothetical protein